MQDRRSKRSPIHWRWLRLLLAVAVLMPIVSTRADVAPVRADDLTDAVAQQQALDKLIAQQKKQLSGISDQQTSLQGQMTTTAQSLDQVSQNVDVLQSQMDDLKTQVGQVQEEYNGLLAGLPLASLNPFAPMPRGEVAQILWNMLQVIAH